MLVNVPTLGLEVNDILPSSVGIAIETIAAPNVLPVPIVDASSAFRGTDPRTIVLESPVNIVGSLVIHAYVIKSGNGKVPDNIPGIAFIVRNVYAPIGPDVKVIVILRVDMHRVVVGMNAGPPDPRCTERIPAVFAHREIKAGLVHSTCVLRIGENIEEIKGALNDGGRIVHLFP